MASLRAIAARSGVSIRTVRRVLYEPHLVSPDAARRVNDVVAKLGYVPNHYARALVGAKTQVIALVVPQLVLHGTNILIVTLQQEIATLGLRSVFYGNEPDFVEQTVVELRQMRPQAVLLVRVGWHDEYRRLLDDDLHLLCVDVQKGLPPDVPGDAVGLDRTTAFRVVTEHLLALGHRRIGLLDSWGAEGRRAGYTQALDAAGMDSRAVAVADSPSMDVPLIRPCMEQLLTDHPDLTALVCMNDVWALEAIHHLADMGRRTPDDISVTGYNDEPWTRWSKPPLTTVDQGTLRLSSHVREMLTRRLEGSTEPWSRLTVRPELVARASTGPVGTQGANSKFNDERRNV